MEKNKVNLLNSEIRNYLKKYDFESAFFLIKSSLSNLPVKDFYIIVTGLVKIDLLKQDIDFSNSINYFNELISENYAFNLNFFKKKIDEAISSKNEKELNIYLEILENAKRLDLDIERKYELYEYIESLQNRLNPSSIPQNSVERKIVEDKYEELLDGAGMILLKPVPDEKLKKIIEECKSYADIDTFQIIDDKDRRRLVLRYVNPIHRKINKEELLQRAKTYHENANYKKSIELYQKILETEKPDLIIYKMLGIEYLSMNEYVKAMEYFLVAAFLSYKKGIELNCEVLYEEANEKLQKERTSKYKYENQVSDACERENISLSELRDGLKYAKIKENKQVMLQVSLYDPETFRKIADISKKALEFKRKGQTYTPYTLPKDCIDENGNNYYPLRDLVGRLRNETRKSKKEKREQIVDFKPFMSVRGSDISYDTDNDYFGIDNFDEIDKYIQNNSLDVETASINLGLSGEQLNILRLIYAREYFTQGYYTNGDMFMHSVEQSESKNEFIIETMKKINERKKFYKNRNNSNRVLSLSLKPKKHSK